MLKVYLPTFLGRNYWKNDLLLTADKVHNFEKGKT